MSEETNVKHSFLRPSRKKEQTSRSEKTRRKSPKPKIKIENIDDTPRFKKKNKQNITNLFNQNITDFNNNENLVVTERQTKPTNLIEQKFVTNIIDKIKSIKFDFFSEDEVVNYAVVEVTETKFGGSGSLFDLKMGPIDDNELCETCENNYMNCPGHYGYISLAAKIPHPLRSKNILEYLTLFCNECNRLVLHKGKIKFLGFDKFTGETRYKKILNEVRKNVNVCPHCEFVLPTYTCIDDKYILQRKKIKYPLRYDDIYKIFSNICDDDITLLGFDYKVVHPTKLIISNLLVLPSCVRPSVKAGGGVTKYDDLTYKYIDIIKTNNKVREETIKKNEKTRLDEIDKLVFHIKTLMDNSKGKAKEINGKRPIKSIKQRLSTKYGRIRQHIQGKRTEYCARTVIGADAESLVDELVIPEEVARTLTYPVVVTKHNKEYCESLINNNKVNYIKSDGILKSAKILLWTQGIKIDNEDIVVIKNIDNQTENPESVLKIPFKKYVLMQKDKLNICKSHQLSSLNMSDIEILKQFIKPGDKLIKKDGTVIENLIEKLPRRKNYNLKEGDILERQLKNGDLCVFNRQPTLWKGSMRAKRVKILPGKTFRFNLSSTQSYNADFDGDKIKNKI